MSILSIIQNAAEDLGLPEPSTIENSTNRLVLQLLRLMVRTSYRMRSMYEWAELDREATITLVAATTDYALPSDYFTRRLETEWNRNAVLPLYGPYTPAQWESIQHGNLSATSQFSYRVDGASAAQLHLYPAPGASDAGYVLSYIYQSKQWAIPRPWEASASWTFTARTEYWCSYNGNVYKVSPGFSIYSITCGTVPPTHTSGTVTDGSVDWIYQSSYLPTSYLNTDAAVLDEMLLEQGICWMYRRLKGAEYADEKKEWLQELRRAKVRLPGAQRLDLSRRNRNRWSNNIPDRGYGI